MAKQSNVSPARAAAFEVLKRVEGGAFSSVVLAEKEPGLTPPDRALCHELVLGTLRRQLFLDKTIEHFASRKIQTLDQSVVLALRLGLYQLRFLTRVPASAAVNESVNLVGQAKLTSARPFVNAVLRRATRESDFDPCDSVGDDLERLAIETSHPLWLLQRWVNSFGAVETAALARANNDVPPTAFRVVTTRTTASQALQRLQVAGAIIESSSLTAGAFRVDGGVGVLREMTAAGEIYLQDEASQLVAQTVEASADDAVLDLCAAPGGKTSQIADSRGDQGLLVAGDISPVRLASVGINVALQHLKSVRLVQLDASRHLPFGDSSFARVLVDAPCSGTGTLRRNPELRWRISADDIMRLSANQKEMLHNAARVVRPGGRLVYSTCSVEKEENEEVVTEFLSSHKSFHRGPLRSSLRNSSGEVRTWPHRHGSDGFFVAAFQSDPE